MKHLLRLHCYLKRIPIELKAKAARGDEEWAEHFFGVAHAARSRAFPVPSRARVCRACCWQAVAFSAGGDGGSGAREQVELRAPMTRLVPGMM
jgi:hypothetical protein